MDKYLLDTNINLDIVKGHPEVSKKLLTPVEIISAIENLQDGGWKDKEIVKSIVRVAEETAKSVLTHEGYHPHFEAFGYPVDSPELTPEENRRIKLMFERDQWINEASHIIGHPGPDATDITAAAATILEASRLRDHIEREETDKARSYALTTDRNFGFK